MVIIDGVQSDRQCNFSLDKGEGIFFFFFLRRKIVNEGGVHTNDLILGAFTSTYTHIKFF